MVCEPLKKELEKWNKYCPRSSGRMRCSSRVASELQHQKYCLKKCLHHHYQLNKPLEHRIFHLGNTTLKHWGTPDNRVGVACSHCSPVAVSSVALLVHRTVIVDEVCRCGPALACDWRIGLQQEGEGHITTFVNLHPAAAINFSAASSVSTNISDGFQWPTTNVNLYFICCRQVSSDLYVLTCLKVDSQVRAFWGRGDTVGGCVWLWTCILILRQWVYKH